MSNSQAQASEDPEPWDEFELQLRAQVLGAGPQRRDQVLYECGFQAGVAEAKRSLRHTARRWRALGVAASLAALASLAAHFFPANSASFKNSVVQRTGDVDPVHAAAPRVSPTSDPWLAQWTKARGDERRNLSTLRASDSVLTITEQRQPPLDVEPYEPDQTEPILQPRDLSLYLRGEA